MSFYENIRKRACDFAIILSMRLLTIILIPFLGLGKTVELPPLPEGRMPNTEVSTNIVLSVDAARLERLSFAFDIVASSAHNLQLAIGSDVNCDGDLSLDEADLTFGYDCGIWFTDMTATGLRTEEPISTEGRQVKVYEIGKRRYDARWNLMKYTRRGLGTISETVEQDETHLKFVITIR